MSVGQVATSSGMRRAGCAAPPWRGAAGWDAPRGWRVAAVPSAETLSPRKARWGQGRAKRGGQHKSEVWTAGEALQMLRETEREKDMMSAPG